MSDMKYSSELDLSLTLHFTTRNQDEAKMAAHYCLQLFDFEQSFCFKEHDSDGDLVEEMQNRIKDYVFCLFFKFECLNME